MMAHKKSHTATEETLSGEKSAAGTIHVSWNGASDVGDLNEYFGKSDSVKKHLDFLNRLSQMLEP